MDFDTLDMARLRGLSSNKWRRYGDEVIPAWVADMDFLQAAPIRDYVARVAATGDLGYPDSGAAAALKAQFAARARSRYAMPVDPERVELLIDVVQGLYLALDMYCEAGDGAVILTPVYPPFLAAAAENERRGIQCTLVPDGPRYVIDFDAVAAAIDDRTRALMFCNPHNPTGRVFLREELESLAELALRHDLTVIADEIFADVVFEGNHYIPFSSLGPEIAARTVSFHSATKSHSLGGIRIALATFGSEALQARYKAVPNRLLGGHNCLGIPLTRIAWEQCEDWLDGLIAYLQGNRDFVSGFLAERLPGVGYLPPEGAFFAWMDFRALDLPGGPFEYFLEHARVALSDGVPFGEAGRGHARLNFATSRKLLTQILERLATAVEK